MSEQELSFGDYVTAINLLAIKAGACNPGEDYCDPEAWRDAYDDDVSPEEAWSEELAVAAADGVP